MFAIKKMRKRAGLMQSEAAKALGMPVRTYGGYEREERQINLREAIELAELFSCTLDELAGRNFVPASGEPSSDLSSDERYVVEAMRSTDARGRAAIMRNAEGEAGVEGASSAGLGSDGIGTNVGRGA